MYDFFEKKYESNYNLGINIKPLVDFLESMLAIDVYYYCGMITCGMLADGNSDEYCEAEMLLLEDELKRNGKKLSKASKDDEQLLENHFRNLLKLSDKKGIDMEIWNLAKGTGLSNPDIALLLFKIQVNIFANLDGSITMLKALNNATADYYNMDHLKV